MAEKVLVEGILYHKIYDINELSSLLVNGTMKSSSGVNIPVTESVLHWAGSAYGGYSSHYQINVCLDVERQVPFLLVADKAHFLNGKQHSHTWKRNTGKIGVSYICMYDIKKYPVTDSMMKFGGQVCEILSDFYKYPINNIKDHEDYAILDDYAGLRWDCELKLSNGETISSRTKRYALEARNKAPVKAREIVKNTFPKASPISVEKKTKTIFEDVYKEDWYSAAIEELEKCHIVYGSKENNKRYFNPNDNLTREQACSILDNFLQYVNKQYKVKSPAMYVPTKKFSDIQGTSIEMSIESMMALGIISGYPDNTFKPTSTLTREELASIFHKLLSYLSTKIKLKSVEIEHKEELYLDVSTTDWSFKSIELVSHYSLMIGYKESTGHYFKPDAFLKRSEFSASVYKLLKYLEKNKIK